MATLEPAGPRQQPACNNGWIAWASIGARRARRPAARRMLAAPAHWCRPRVILKPIVSPSPIGSTVSLPPRGIACCGDHQHVEQQLDPVLRQQHARQIPGRAWSCRPRESRAPPSRRRRVRSARRPSPPRRRRCRQNCSLAEAVCALFWIRSSANSLVSSSLSSSSTSRPLTIAPTGLIRSWQTREHSSAARSRASRVTGGARHANLLSECACS